MSLSFCHRAGDVQVQLWEWQMMNKKRVLLEEENRKAVLSVGVKRNVMCTLFSLVQFAAPPPMSMWPSMKEARNEITTIGKISRDVIQILKYEGKSIIDLEAWKQKTDVMGKQRILEYYLTERVLWGFPTQSTNKTALTPSMNTFNLI